MTRCGSAWATVRPINVAVKKKTELFAPKSRGRAHVTVDTLGVALVTCPGTCGTTLAGPRHAPQDRGCALFSVVAAGGGAACVARAVVRAVLCLPVTAILDPDTDSRDQPVFCKCDRVPQSQLVQVLCLHFIIYTCPHGMINSQSFMFPHISHFPTFCVQYYTKNNKCGENG